MNNFFQGVENFVARKKEPLMKNAKEKIKIEEQIHNINTSTLNANISFQILPKSFKHKHLDNNQGGIYREDFTENLIFRK